MRILEKLQRVFDFCHISWSILTESQLICRILYYFLSVICVLSNSRRFDNRKCKIQQNLKRAPRFGQFLSSISIESNSYIRIWTNSHLFLQFHAVIHSHCRTNCTYKRHSRSCLLTIMWCASKRLINRRHSYAHGLGSLMQGRGCVRQGNRRWNGG